MESRKLTHSVKVGRVIIGGGAPVVVQSMTNTDTADIESSIAQVYELWRNGSEIVRLTVNNHDAAKAIPYIYDGLVKKGWEAPALVGDFHYIGHELLDKHPECAARLAKYRINPGNVGFGKKYDKNFASMIEQAIAHDKPVRIGVNWGSLDKGLLAKRMDDNLSLATPLSNQALMESVMVESALSSARFAESIGLAEDKIILSAKLSQVQGLVRVYRALSEACQYPLHLGLTEAGMDSKGVVATATSFALLLNQGIGDTIRASLTPAPGGARSEEVRVCQEILQVLGIRAFTPLVTACPGCGRTTSTLFQSLAQSIQQFLREEMPKWRQKNPDIAELSVAVMGCVVNGPGESKHADIGVSLPGTGETPAAPVFVDGEKCVTLRGTGLAEEFQWLLRQYIQLRYEEHIGERCQMLKNQYAARQLSLSKAAALVD